MKYTAPYIGAIALFSAFTKAMGSEYIEKMLAAHNEFRANYNAAPLAWNASLEASAKHWADNCQLRYVCSFYYIHLANLVPSYSQGRLGSLGENIGDDESGSSNLEAGLLAIKRWRDEQHFRGIRGVPTEASQMIWKATTSLGCHTTLCLDLESRLTVCHYDPPGNIYGEFDENVEYRDSTEN